MHVCVPVGGVVFATVHPGPTYCGEVGVPDEVKAVTPVTAKTLLPELETTAVPV